MRWNKFFWLSLVFLAYFFISLPDYSGDIKNHVIWGKSILHEGTYGFYDRVFPGYSFPTYPPFVMLLFAISFGLYELSVFLAAYLNANFGLFPSNLIHFLNWENVRIAYLKLPGVISTILMSVLVYKFWEIEKEKSAVKNGVWLLLLFLINPAVIYLSAVWGQTDVLQYLFIILAIYFAHKNRIVLSYLCAVLGILSKQTVVVLWALYFLYIFKQYGFKKMIYGGVLNLVIFYLAYFIFQPPSLYWPIKFYQANFELVNFLLVENSYNLWTFIFGFASVDSGKMFSGISLDVWGYVLFLVFAAPLTLKFYFGKFSLEKLFQFLFLISLTYFFFLSRMHERYLTPAIIFGTILAMYSKKYWLPLGFFSALHFLNLYRGLYVPQIHYLREVVDNLLFVRIMILIYGSLLIFFIVDFLKIRLNRDL